MSLLVQLDRVGGHEAGIPLRTEGATAVVPFTDLPTRPIHELRQGTHERLRYRINVIVGRMHMRVVDQNVPVLNGLVVQFNFVAVRHVVDRRLVVAKVRTTARRRTTRDVNAADVRIAQVAGPLGNRRINGRAQIVA